MYYDTTSIGVMASRSVCVQLEPPSVSPNGLLNNNLSLVWVSALKIDRKYSRITCSFSNIYTLDYSFTK